MFKFFSNNIFLLIIFIDLFVPFIKRKLTCGVGLLVSLLMCLSFLFLKIPKDCEDGICTIKII